MHFLVFFLSVFNSLFSMSSAEASKSLSSFSIDLIHRDSPLSPLYNPSLTSSDRIKNAVLRSIYRSKQVALSMDENKSPETIIVPDQGEYLMRFFIGTPPVERFAIADTGSDLIWVQCSPCENCFPQDTPLFEPDKSSTFTILSCDSQPCLLLPLGQHTCSDLGHCIYSYLYGDKSSTVGLLGTESITFASMGGNQNITFPKSTFGCGLHNNLTFGIFGKLSGIVGLGAGPLSLVSQLGDQIGHKFSYCLLPPGSNFTSKLKFGSEAILTGNGVVSTPLTIKPSFPSYYFLNLEGVTIGEKTVQIGKNDGNIVIDSGTVLTYLEQSFYNNFVTSLQEALGVETVQDVPFPLDFCFPYQPNMNLPYIVFQFTGANVSVNPENMFLIDDDSNMLCLATVPRNGISILGNLAQIDFQVEYDLQEKKVYFAPTDCTKI